MQQRRLKTSIHPVFGLIAAPAVQLDNSESTEEWMKKLKDQRILSSIHMAHDSKASHEILEAAKVIVNHYMDELKKGHDFNINRDVPKEVCPVCWAASVILSYE